MKNRGSLANYAMGTLMSFAISACAVQMDAEVTAVDNEAIVNGTAVNLDANSFVRFPAASCSGTMLTNQWVLTANHCQVQVGNAVQMDTQSRTVARVVRNPGVDAGIDVALVQMSAPMAVLGSLTGFTRNLRSTLADSGTHLRCYGYGQSDGIGISAQLRYEKLDLAGSSGNVYRLNPNSLLQYPGSGDAGGGCLDDTGAAIGVMLSYPPGRPTQVGQTFVISSSSIRNWANFVLAGQCTANSDCTTGLCNSSNHTCVTSTCFDGVKNNGETRVDCGGSCAECKVTCPTGKKDCSGICTPIGNPCP
jgi:hypothetical protein